MWMVQKTAIVVLYGNLNFWQGATEEVTVFSIDKINVPRLFVTDRLHPPLSAVVQPVLAYLNNPLYRSSSVSSEREWKSHGSDCTMYFLCLCLVKHL